MSQQHPRFPPHLPRGAAAASALPMPMSSVTTVPRGSPTIQVVPAAPSVPSASTPGPGPPPAAALGRSHGVISALRPSTPPTAPSAHTPSPAVGVADDGRTNLIVQGPAAVAGGLPAPLPGQPLHFTLTQRVNPPSVGLGPIPGGAAVNISDAMRITPLGGSGKTVQVAPQGVLGAQKVALGVGASHSSVGSLAAGVGIRTHHHHHHHHQLQQQQAMLAAASKAGGMQLSGAMAALGISSPPAAPLHPTTSIVVSTSQPVIPVARVTPQRQQQPSSAALPMGPSGSGFTTLTDPSCMATQTGVAPAGQLLLSQTPHGQSGGSVAVSAATAGGSGVVSGAVPPGCAATSSVAQPMQEERAVFNLTAATATPGSGGQGQGQDQGTVNLWLQQLIYQQQQQQQQRVPPVVSPAPSAVAPNAGGPLVRSSGSKTFLPRQHAEQSRLSSQTPTLAASLSLHPHPHPSAVLFNPQMVMEGGALRQQQHAAPPSPASSQLPVSALCHTAAAATAAASTLSSLGAGIGQQGNNTAASMLSPSRVATVASSLISMATANPAQASSPSQQGGGGGGSAGASPRPSILRKRTVDGNCVLPRKPNFNLMWESHSPRPDTAPPSNISSPKTPATENSQSSTDTALSSNDVTTPAHPAQGEVKVKTETAETGGAGVSSPAVSNASDVTPRKRARKQLFDKPYREVTEEVKAESSSDNDGDNDNGDEVDDDDDDKEEEELDSRNGLLPDIQEDHPLKHQEEYIDEEGVRWTREKTQQTMSIMGEYCVNWRPKFNHFQRFSDIRPKEERNPTVNELISHRGILQKASGWRLYHVCTQMEEVMEDEESMGQRMERLEERLTALTSTHLRPQPSLDTDHHKLRELFRGNLQRCHLVQQQMGEARASLLGLLKHAPKIRDIITRNLAKRTIRKKERA